MNDDLLVVGNLAWNNGERSIVAWQVTDVEGVLVAMDPIVVATGMRSGAASLNNQGFVAATLDDRAFRWQVVWNPDLGDSGGLQVASTEQLFDPHVLSYAADINEAGTVCGEVSVFGGGHAAYAKTLDGSLLELPLLKVNTRKQRTKNVSARAINDSGQIVGIAEVISIRSGSIEGRPAVLWNIGDRRLRPSAGLRGANCKSTPWGFFQDTSGVARTPSVPTESGSPAPVDAKVRGKPSSGRRAPA